jgi:hypothetical protein
MRRDISKDETIGKLKVFGASSSERTLGFASARASKGIVGGCHLLFWGEERGTSGAMSERSPAQKPIWASQSS